MGKLVTRGSKYTDEQRISAAVIYAAKGTYSAVTREMNIPKSTLSNWSKTDWWDATVVEVRTEKSGEHRANYVEIIDKAQQQVIKALPKANAAQANLIACQATDKVRLHDGMPTSINVGQDNRELCEVWKELSRTMRDHGVVSVQKDSSVQEENNG